MANTLAYYKKVRGPHDRTFASSKLECFFSTYIVLGKAGTYLYFQNYDEQSNLLQKSADLITCLCQSTLLLQVIS
jgi:hypothetical protein